MVSFFIPKKINVGFQERNGTYTGKLAYIIYFDEKGNLRKEKSWNGWRNEHIDNEIHENEPTSGFVLNKKAGGYSTGWNHRQTYVRVYDPRGFEFEITVPNLLYILENATSTKGKGLEGDFVYGWDGKDLVLIPVDAPDYKELVELNALRHAKNFIKTKELILGATYRTKGNQELIYIGRFDEYDYYGKKKAKPQFYFYTSGGYFDTKASISQQLVEVISEEPVENYADIMDKLEKQSCYSPIDKERDEYVPYTKEELEKKFEVSRYSYNIYFKSGDKVDLRKGNEGYYYEYKNPNYKPNNYWNRQQNAIYDERYYLKVEFKDADEVIEKLKPLRLRKYLANGKVYSEGY